MMNFKVCFISVYFGEIPSFFSAFLNSCEWNSKYDWLIIHDKEIKYEHSSNVHLLHMTMEEFIVRVNSVTGMSITSIKPYKVCDFRPAFGEIFQEELKGYDFWGISDTDMLLGDLSHFINDELLSRYDKIFTMGHLSLIRNNLICNSLYKKDTLHSRNYKSVFGNPMSCVYDEYEGFTEKFIDEGLNVYTEKLCADIMISSGRINVVTRNKFRLIQPRNNYIYCCESKNYLHQIFVLEKGHIYKYYYQKGRIYCKEYMYIHKLEHTTNKKITSDDSLIITVNGYINSKDFFEKLRNHTVNEKLLDCYNKEKHWKKFKDDVYVWIRLNIRNFRKKWFPRRYEI